MLGPASLPGAEPGPGIEVAEVHRCAVHCEAAAVCVLHLPDVAPSHVMGWHGDGMGMAWGWHSTCQMSPQAMSAACTALGHRNSAFGTVNVMLWLPLGPTRSSAQLEPRSLAIHNSFGCDFELKLCMGLGRGCS